MDPSILGSVIGIGILACLGLTVVLQDKGATCWTKTTQRIQRWRQQRQPLLPVVTQNPVLVRSGSSQWKMKQLLDLK